MELEFYKAHGIGNDFVIIDTDSQNISLSNDDYRRICDRNFGIGADQIILIDSKEGWKVRFLNADGTEAEMCGNGIRCAAAYVWNIRKVDEVPLRIGTLAGEMVLEKRGKLVLVDMGEPVLEGRKIPVDADGQIVDYSLKVDDKTFPVNAVSMGNPHCVLFGSDESFELSRLGPLFENHPFFPNRVNFEYVTVSGRNRIKVRVWERGTGITLACGTGACASVVAAILNKLTDRKVSVDLPGGQLEIEWREDNNHVMMAGPAEIVFKGRLLN